MLKNWQKILVRKLHVNGMALFPFLLIQREALWQNNFFINHERIHFRQQIELVILPFYLLYLLHYLINRIKYRDHDTAYRNICFEREAYSNEKNLQYLKERKFFSWTKYF